jgi:hypothetical protein
MVFGFCYSLINEGRELVVLQVVAPRALPLAIINMLFSKTCRQFVLAGPGESVACFRADARVSCTLWRQTTAPLHLRKNDPFL